MKEPVDRDAASADRWHWRCIVLRSTGRDAEARRASSEKRNREAQGLPDTWKEAAMKNEKEARKLGIEELERRVAPSVFVDDPVLKTSEPTGGDDPSAGGGVPPEVVPDQPGNSDGNRDKLWHENVP